MFKNLIYSKCSRVVLLIGKTKRLFERSGAYYYTWSISLEVPSSSILDYWDRENILRC